MILKLYDYSGEFCTRRTTTGLQEIKLILRKSITSNTPIILSLEKVKLITPSYIDELLPDLMAEFGKEKVLGLVKFDQALNKYVAEQIERGFKNRIK
jgi:hypothetical protein